MFQERGMVEDRKMNLVLVTRETLVIHLDVKTCAFHEMVAVVVVGGGGGSDKLTTMELHDPTPMLANVSHQRPNWGYSITHRPGLLLLVSR